VRRTVAGSIVRLQRRSHSTGVHRQDIKLR
jgi:hypothetical protein